MTVTGENKDSAWPVATGLIMAGTPSRKVGPGMCYTYYIICNLGYLT